MLLQNDSGISTPGANSEKSRIRFVVQQYIAALLRADPYASATEIRHTWRIARATFEAGGSNDRRRIAHHNNGGTCPTDLTPTCPVCAGTM
jgi:hypothetical protein